MGARASTGGDGLPPGVTAVTLTSNQGLAFSGSAKIGGQLEQVILDTGSTTLAVAGSTCSNCGVSPEYTPGASATDQHMMGSSQYADNSGWSGEIFQDSGPARRRRHGPA